MMRQDQASAAEGGQVDITALLGTWVNSNRETEWIQKFILANEGGTFTIHPFAAQAPHDWGTVSLSTYTDNIHELAFHAVVDLELMESVLAGNTNKNLIVIAAFHKYKDGSGRKNYLCREFYYRVAGPGQ